MLIKQGVQVSAKMEFFKIFILEMKSHFQIVLIVSQACQAPRSTASCTENEAPGITCMTPL